jgi:hypothetical protein
LFFFDLLKECLLDCNIDIRVYKGYIFVQYDRIDDARKLIEQGQNSLILKGNKLGKKTVFPK